MSWITVHKLSNKQKKLSAELGFKPGAVGWEPGMFPLCYAAPLSPDKYLMVTESQFRVTAKSYRQPLAKKSFFVLTVFVSRNL